MIDLKPLIDLSFWFDLRPYAFSPIFERTLFLGFVLLIVFGSVGRIVARQKKEDRHQQKLYFMIGQMLLWMGVFGLIWFTFTFEEAYLIGARFWFLLWLVGLVVWIGYIVRYAKRGIPALKEAEYKKSQHNEYLPRKKKR